MKIVITGYKDKMVSCGFEGNRLELFDCFEKEGDIVGNVYLGRVAEKAENIDACFVTIAPKVKCFLNARECRDGVLPRVGDEIVVRVKASGVRSKLPSCTMFLKNSQKEAVAGADHAALYTCLYKEVQNFIKSIKSVPFEQIDGIITDSADVFKELTAALPEFGESGLIRFYDDEDLGLDKLYSVNERVGELLDRRVWLKSGAYLVIEHTETLHVIDVNSGRYEKKKCKGDSTHEINLEAAAEAARQIRLRNLSGIILVDFINYPGDAGSPDQDALKARLAERIAEELSRDPMRPALVDITPLFLAEITRRKKMPPVYEIIS